MNFEISHFKIHEKNIGDSIGESNCMDGNYNSKSTNFIGYQFQNILLMIRYNNLSQIINYGQHSKPLRVKYGFFFIRCVKNIACFSKLHFD